MFLHYLRDDPPSLAVLIEIFGTSPFLTETLIRNPEVPFDRSYRSYPRARVYARARDHEQLPATLRRTQGRPEQGRRAGAGGGAPRLKIVDSTRPADQPNDLDALKRFKRRELAVIAARDILGRDTLQVVTRRLSELASEVVDRALDIVAAEQRIAEGLDRLPGRFGVIGMGKLGGEELNYSSDIDLIYVYEPEDEEDASAHAGSSAWREADGRTGTQAESYCYRVDLRLAADGSSRQRRPLLEQCRQVLQRLGRHIRALCAHQGAAHSRRSGSGRRSIERVQPFVYREYLDHAALEEIYQHKASVDRAIAAAARERNVKLGRGGIREVELFTQVLQLTYGAGQPDLRQANTLLALEALERAGQITAAVRDELAQSYIFLRTVEHRLQMVQENQTHSLPESRQELEICARRLRFARVEELEVELETRRARVHEVYRGLFERQRGSTVSRRVRSSESWATRYRKTKRVPTSPTAVFETPTLRSRRFVRSVNRRH